MTSLEEGAFYFYDMSHILFGEGPISPEEPDLVFSTPAGEGAVAEVFTILWVLPSPFM